MTVPFDAFLAMTAELLPRAGVVLGSGLSGATVGFVPQAVVAYADIPGLVPPTIDGHRGQLAVGLWAGVPTLVCFGRVHFYEGHSWERVTRLVELLAQCGVRRLILTNAAGGIHDQLEVGSLMAIRQHLKILGPTGAADLAAPSPPLYSEHLINLMVQFEARVGRELFAGTYASVTGPSYETPAEIRAFRAAGADAVGMSTAREAEAARRFHMEVAAISTITNRAAGLAEGRLNHAEVEVTARTAVSRLSRLLQSAVSSRQ